MTGKTPILLALSALVLATLACGTTTFNSTQANFDIIDTVVEPIQVSAPDGDARVTLNFAFGEIDINGGLDDGFIDGEYTYNVEQLEPATTVDGVNITIGNQEDEYRFTGFPPMDENQTIESHWDLRFGDHPTALELNVGAGDNNLDFGGMALTDLSVRIGASSTRLEFSELNLVEMDRFEFESGAADARLDHLANANTGDMRIQVGAGDFTLDFSGDLQQDLDVEINAGVGQLTIIVPEGVNANVQIDSAITNIDIGGAWRQSGDTYTNAGEGPSITIQIDAGLGNINLEN